jgi:thiol-disulfide isomerase/thioredoxin
MTLNIPSTLLISVAFLVNSLLPLSAGGRSEKIVVGKIDKAGLEHLMREGGSPSILVMMASWCGPCRKDLPSLIKLYEKYRPRGLKMFGISFEYAGPSAIQKLLDNLNANFPVYWAEDDVLRDYGINAIPMLFLIKDGKIVEKIIGSRTEDFLDRKIGDFLK